MAKRTQHLKREAQATLAAALNAHWAIHTPALTASLSALESIIETGQVDSNHVYSRAVSEAYTTKTVIDGNTAIIPIVGMIRPRPDFYTKWMGATACSEIMRDLNAALADDAVEQIIFLVDSPGGSVTNVEETAQKIYAARGTKPMTAYVVGMNASAAYYLSSAADKIVAAPSSLTGSIGTVIMHGDYSGAYAEYGIKVTPIHFGKHKVDGNPYQPLDEQGRASLQEVVDTFGKQFVGAVATHRNQTPEIVRAQFGDGKIFVAEEAKTRGLVDEVGELNERIVSRSASQLRSKDERPKIEQSIERIAPLSGLSAITSGINFQSALGASYESNQPSGQSNPAPTLSETKTVNKIKALLFGLSLLTKIDASDEAAQAAVSAFCHARGVAVPVNAQGELVEAEVVKILSASSGTATPNQATGSTTPSAQAARDQELAEAREQAAAEARQRRDDVEAIAALVNQTREVVSTEDVRLAVDGKDTVAAIQKAWVAKLNASEGGQGLSLPAQPQGTNSAREDKWAATAVSAMLDQCGLLPRSERPKEGFGDLGSMSVVDIAAECLSNQTGGRRRVTNANREEIASEALQMGPHGRRSFGDVSAGPAYNRPGDFPNLMSNLAGKILDTSLELSDTTYQEYTSKMSDADDFKPSSIIAVGSFDTIDDVGDGEDYKSLQMDEELKGWIAINRKGNAVQLTPVMVANNDLDSFMTQLQTLGFAHDNTLNYLCLSILMGNPTLVDGSVMISTGRGNLVDSGGAPSAAQARLMRQLHRRTKGVGTNKTIRSVPRVVLVPTEHEDAARQTYAPFGEIPEMKNAQTDATINVHRGTVKIVVEPDLEGFTNGTKKWFTFDTRLRTIVHRFMSGYGRGGRRTTWYNPTSDCRSYGVEGRFSAAAVGYRGVVQNDGE